MKKEEYLEASFKLIDESQGEQEPYIVTICGEEFVVDQGAFSPKYFEETEWLTNQVLESIEERGSGSGRDGRHTLLEIGPGIGATTVIAALHACLVTAVDINPRALELTWKNVREHHDIGVREPITRRIRLFEGSVYAPLLKGERFDTIYWNVPFGLTEREDLTLLQRSVADPGYRAIRECLVGAVERLTVDGRLLIGFSDTIGEADLLQQFAAEGGLTLVKRSSIEGAEVYPVTFDLYEGRKID